MTAPGERFLRRFSLERPLGVGGFAEVWLARDDAGTAVAVKLQRLDVRADAAARAFAREGARATELRHPHLVRVFEAGVEDGRGYLVMEHVDGVTLEEELDTRRAQGRGVTVGEVRRWTRQLSQAIDALHAASLIHRDLKPSNVMIQGAAHDVVLLDLGLAHDAELAAEELTTLGRVKGTTMYMSPEQARGERVGPASDVFALTTIVFELLTGVRPWLHNEHGGMLLVGQRVPARSNDRVEVLRRLSAGRRPLPSLLAGGLPPVLDRVFAAGWQQDPALRPMPTSAWAERLDAAFASVSPELSAWMRPGRDAEASLAGARAPGVLVERSRTPVAETRAVPGPDALTPEAVETQRTPSPAAVTPESPSRPRRWGLLGASSLALLLSVALLVLMLRSRGPRDPATLGAEAVAERARTTEGIRAGRVSAVAGTSTAEAQPSADADVTRWPDAPAADVRPSSTPTHSAAPRAPARTRPNPSSSTSPPGAETPAEYARALRGRLDGGASIDEVARAVLGRAATLDPERRRAIERWTRSATELGDPRPLYLAIDALAAR